MTDSAPLAAASTAAEDGASSEAAPLPLLLDRWLAALRAAAERLMTIAALEVRLAALNFTLMLAVAVASGLLLASSWIALFAAIVAGLHAIGLPWHLALLLVALVNFALAVAGFFYINRMSNHLIFNTLRALVAELEPRHANNAAGTAGGNAAPATPD